MAWETRGNQRYYYRARKVNGRVIKEYVGTGAAAEAAAAEDEARRIARAKRKSVSIEGDPLTSLMDSYLEFSDIFFNGSLVASGYYRHHGGEWRRRRGQ
jgi:hypothetical protein